MDEVGQILHDQHNKKENNEKRDEADVDKTALNKSCPFEEIKDDTSLNKDKLKHKMK